VNVDQQIITNSMVSHDENYPLEKPQGTYRILIIGDSLRKPYKFRFEETFSKLLQKHLNRTGSGLCDTNHQYGKIGTRFFGRIIWFFACLDGSSNPKWLLWRLFMNECPRR
jgi:NADH:ubiquinone oxidoreductase subunit D